MTTKTIAYEVEVRGIRGVITNQTDLTAAVKETTKAYKAADFGSDEYKASEKELAKLKTLQAQFRQDVKDTARDQQIAADRGKGSYRALNAELVNLRRSYKELSAAERDIAGKDTLARIQQLDRELKDIDSTIGQNQRNVGNYADAFSGLGGFDFAALASGPAAIAAIGAAALQAGAYVLEMSAEVRELSGEIQNLTDKSGDELDGLTSRVLAIGETFKVSNEEVTNAANAVAKQLGIPFEDALARIEEGFIAGSNQTDEFLSNLLEYPAQFTAVFGEGEQAADALFSTLNQQATQGIFSDKGVDTIKEAGLSLRELPQTARDALTAIGLASDDIQKQIEDEGIGAAIATVSTRLGELQADSPEVGQALADIFKGAGEDAGLDFVISLKDINAQTGELIDTTNKYQQEQLRTLEVNKEFAAAQVEVTNALGGTGATFDNVGTQIQTVALQILVPLIAYVREFFSTLAPLGESLKNVAVAFGFVSEDGSLFTSILDLMAKGVSLALKPLAAAVKVVSTLANAYASAVTSVRSFLGLTTDANETTRQAGQGMGRYARQTEEAASELDKLRKAEEEERKEKEKSTKTTRDFTREIRNQQKASKEAAVEADAAAKGSSAAIKAEISSLKKELDTLSGEDQVGVLAKLLKAEEALKAVDQYRKDIRQRLSQPVKAVARIETQVIEEVGPATKTLDQRLADIETLKLRQIASAREVADTEEEFVRARSRVTLIAERSTAQARLNQEELTANERLSLEQEVADKTVAINASKNEALLAQEEERTEGILQASGLLFEGLNAAFSALTDASEARANNEISALETRYNREIDLAEGNEERQEELREELAEARAEIEAEEFERQKRIRIATATAALAEGIVNILATPTTIPEPFAVPYKALRIGFLTATTASQIANIQSETIAAGGAIIDGVARGQSHTGPNGGIDTVIHG